MQEMARFQKRDPATKTGELDLEYQSQSHAEIGAIQLQK